MPGSPLARYLAALYGLLAVYATLYPFDWHWRDVAPWAFVAAPWPKYVDPLDVAMNFGAYVPMGLLLAAALRPRLAGPWLVLAAAALGSALSFVLEALQTYVPKRFPLQLDWASNSAGALLGALLAAWLVPRLPLAAQLYARRKAWLRADASFGLVLLLLWPLAQLYPQPALFASGYSLAAGLDALRGALDLPPAWQEWIDAWQPDGLSRPQLQVLTALATAASGSLVGALVERGAPRAALCLLLVAAGCAVASLSAAMSFGPQHALVWFNELNAAPLLFGLVLAIGLAHLPPRAAELALLVLLLAYVALVNQMVVDPYRALNLQAWQQGRFIRFHGLSEWLALAWPYAALLYAGGRLLRGGGA